MLKWVNVGAREGGAKRKFTTRSARAHNAPDGITDTSEGFVVGHIFPGAVCTAIGAYDLRMSRQ